MKIIPVFAESLGAKSFSFYLEVGDINIFIDPGIALLQPSYPANDDLKMRWYMEGRQRIIEYLMKADVVTITHYHHDHYLWREEDITLYRDKLLLIKNPNIYINDRQRIRAYEFLKSYLSINFGEDIDSQYIEPTRMDFGTGLEGLKLSLERDFGDYSERREELLKKGRRWFENRVSKWISSRWIGEYTVNDIGYRFADGRCFDFGDTKIRFTSPHYHGIEYARTGWVLSLVVEYGGRKILYSSDLMGPIIEDYAHWILKEDPDILLLDGPPTYLIPRMFNLINLRRTIENVVNILCNSRRIKTVIYDHHIMRDVRFRKWVGEVYEAAWNCGVEIVDVASYLGLTPVYEKIK